MEIKNPSNLTIYNQVRTVPEEAQRPFKSNYGKTLTEIDPMWRIKKLTELFGPAGEGWFTSVTRQETKEFSNGEVGVFVDLELYILRDPKNGKWTKPIKGTGGNKLVMKTQNGLEVNDEAYKMAYTDALGIACKALGFGADIYSGSFDTKYNKAETSVTATPAKESAPKSLPTLSPSHPRWAAFVSWAAKKGAEVPTESIAKSIRKSWVITDDDLDNLMKEAGRG